eukprot:363618-Chlamydomonas_euryale.AAC.3
MVEWTAGWDGWNGWVERPGGAARWDGRVERLGETAGWDGRVERLGGTSCVDLTRLGGTSCVDLTRLVESVLDELRGCDGFRKWLRSSSTSGRDDKAQPRLAAMRTPQGQLPYCGH